MMDHNEVRDRLSAYIDHELSAADSLELEGHVKRCADCAEELEAMRRLVGRAGELPRSLQPELDLWPGLRARLTATEPAKHSRRSWFSWWGTPAGLAAAAAAAILVAGGLWIWSTGRAPGQDRRVEIPVANNETSIPPDINVVDSSGEARPGGVARMIWALEEESLGAGKALMASMQGKSGPLASEGFLAIDSSLRSLDLAIEESVAVLNRDPDNPELLRRVTGYYRQRLSLLKTATRLANQA